MNVSAIIVTRGDVHMYDVLASIPAEWEIITWDNSFGGQVVRRGPAESRLDVSGRPHEMIALDTAGDLGVYGRYAAIKYARTDLIYVQDDDCIVSDPRAFVEAWLEAGAPPHGFSGPWHVVCNMPPEFRHSFYEDHALVGFGAAFHRDAPRRAFERFWRTHDLIDGLPADGALVDEGVLFHQTCDVVFTGLTPRVLVDVPHRNLPWADADNRMWKQPDHQARRSAMLELVRERKRELDAA